ncbi:nucleoside-diphosphate sugar epimerase/dehydratase [Synechococcus sp. NB0720_010]|uniref:polysaccharide biosynthesis protein n=1 Tax=Synechococcus sp. NB0720_010 TaxID=2907159 RepID=UPI001FF98366|nr:nucleoside-diphosphate sugar epimerase/dehydratase [Synechococcus sp. NB0720_010]UPH89122.1 polysaccharide biosynthesis protein [Synechococcus sp. NB0720_010]
MSASIFAFRTLTTTLVRLGPLNRRLLLIVADALLLPLAVWLSFWLRLADPFTPNLMEGLWLLPAIWLLGLPFYALSGQYKGLTRYVGSLALYRLAGRNGLLVLLLALTGLVLRLPLPPRSSWLLLWVLLTGFTGTVRFALRDVLLSMQNKPRHALTRVAIYGAGAAGVQLAAALRLAGSHIVELFVDDAPHLWRRDINGVPIQPPQLLRERAAEIDQVLMAIPSLSRSRRRRITADLQELGIPLLQVPSMDDITSGRARIDALRPIAIEELLGRDAVAPNPDLLGLGIAGACVCVTGAGGSIGSELCRQILRLRPRRLVLLEHSEPSLYAMHQELQGLLPAGVDLEPVLGSATDAALVERLLRQQGVTVVFHAAAYKHVPLVEANPLAGLANNVLSTRVVCRAAAAACVNEVVLISTDKAVRPTNVMGASKRVAELVVQAQAQELAARALERGSQPATRLAMVRFGNVLGSSGSVVPLFRRQIAEGGPITLTHPEIIRYFMTIPEAAQLVLQAAVLAKGADVFLLDMGEPVRIKDLAEQMVRLSGLSLRDARNPGGDIEIVCTGLRPGEKLFEELLIDAESEPTEHPLIYRAHERAVPPAELWPQIDALEVAIQRQDTTCALEVLAGLVPEWQRDGGVNGPGATVVAVAEAKDLGASLTGGAG